MRIEITGDSARKILGNMKQKYVSTVNASHALHIGEEIKKKWFAWKIRCAMEEEKRARERRKGKRRDGGLEDARGKHWGSGGLGVL